MIRKVSILIVFFAVSVFVFFSCKEKQFTPVKGEISASADESLFRVVEGLKNEFVSLYPTAKINLTQSAARVGIPDLLEGKIQLLVCGRNLNNEELEFIKKNKMSNINQFKFCYDGVVLLVQKGDKKENISLKEIRDLLNGADKSYKVFMPQFKSSTYEYIKGFLLNGKDPLNVKLVEKEVDILEEVKRNSKSIGLVGLNVIADSSAFKFLKVSADDNVSLTGITYYEPHPGYLSHGDYPLAKLCYVFTNESYVGVAGGFATFLTGNEGQKIVLRKFNLGPLHYTLKYK